MIKYHSGRADRRPARRKDYDARKCDRSRQRGRGKEYKRERRAALAMVETSGDRSEAEEKSIMRERRAGAALAMVVTGGA